MGESAYKKTPVIVQVVIMDYIVNTVSAIQTTILFLEGNFKLKSFMEIFF